MGPYHDVQPFPLHVHHLRWARRGLLTAVVLAGLAAGCGKSSSLSAEAADPGDAEKVTLAVGSDTHLVNLARETARDANAGTGSDTHLEELAKQAEPVTQPHDYQ